MITPYSDVTIQEKPLPCLQNTLHDGEIALSIAASNLICH